MAAFAYSAINIEVLEQQTDDPYLAEVTREVRADVEGGSLLSEAMARHPKVFSRLYVAMVEAGEAAGILDTVLDRVAVQIEKETSIKRRVKGAMIYPSIVLSFAFVVLNAMLLFVIPVFTKMFDQLGGQLPMLTRFMVAASDLLRARWFLIFPSMGLAVLLVRRWKNSTEGRKKWDAIKLRIP